MAGTGSAGYSGDGGWAVNAQLNYPFGVYVSGSGVLYLADRENNRIRRVDGKGIITTVAGTGSAGYSGDGRTAERAELNRPRGVWVDEAGNIYIADTDNHRVRQVDRDGIITTVAGTGRAGYSGDGGAAMEAQLNRPHGVWGDGNGNVFIVDTNNNRICRVDGEGIITTVAGTSSSENSGDNGKAIKVQLNYPAGIYGDDLGSLYIADTNNHRIHRIGLDGTIATIAGAERSGYAGDRGLATQAQLSYPTGVWVDRDGNLYVADTGNHRIRRMEWASESAKLEMSATSLMFDETEVGSGAQQGLEIWNVGKGSLTLSGIEVVGDDASSFSVSVESATMGFWSHQTMTVNFRPQSMGEQEAVLRLTHNAPELANPVEVVLRGRGILAEGSWIIRTVAGGGSALGDGWDAVQAGLRGPSGMGADAVGDVYIADTDNHRIRRVDEDGIITTVAGTGRGGYSGDGRLAVQAQLNQPYGIYLEGANSGFYIADTDNHRIRRVDEDGIITTVAGTGRAGYSGDGIPAEQAELNRPHGLWVDEAGNVYIADTDNHRIRRVGTGSVMFHS